MATVGDVAEYLELLAPPALAAEWDNVGLLLGDRERQARRVMTCLTVTPESAGEAVAGGADLVVTHHPIPFRPLRQINTESHEGRLLWMLASAGVSVFSAHTAFDSALRGINQQLAEGLALENIGPLVAGSDPRLGAGSGRFGQLAEPVTLRQLARRTTDFLKLPGLQVVGRDEAMVSSVGIACGSAGEFLGVAAERGCQAFVTGEVRFHTCLEAQALGVQLLLTGHFASERFAMTRLADELAEHFAGVEVWASREEHDPLRWVE